MIFSENKNYCLVSVFYKPLSWYQLFDCDIMINQLNASNIDYHLIESVDSVSLYVLKDHWESQTPIT